MNNPNGYDSPDSFGDFRRIIAQKHEQNQRRGRFRVLRRSGVRHRQNIPGTSTGMLRTWADRLGEAVGGVLERRIALVLAGCLTLLLAGMSASLIAYPDLLLSYTTGTIVPLETQAVVDRPESYTSLTPPRALSTDLRYDASDPLSGDLSLDAALDLPGDLSVIRFEETPSLAAEEDSLSTDPSVIRSETVPAKAVVEDSGGIDLESAPNEAFMIRVGSFRNASNADRVVNSLREEAPDVRSEQLASGLHSVTAGPFLKKVEAEAVARSAREAMGLAPQVVRLDLD